MSRERSAVQSGLSYHRQQAKDLGSSGNFAQAGAHLVRAAWINRASAGEVLNLIRFLVRRSQVSLAEVHLSNLLTRMLDEEASGQFYQVIDKAKTWLPLHGYYRALIRMAGSNFGNPKLQAIELPTAIQLTLAAWRGRRRDAPPSILNFVLELDELAEACVRHHYRLIETSIIKLNKREVRDPARLKRIAIVTNSLSMGGNERNATVTAEKFAESGLFEKVYLVYGDKRLRDEFFADGLQKSGLEVVDINQTREEAIDPSSKDPSLEWLTGVPELIRCAEVVGKSEIAKLREFFSANQVDVVHSFSSDARNVQVALAALDTRLAYVGLNPGSLSPVSRPGRADSEQNQIVKAVYRGCSQQKPTFNLLFCSLAAAQDYSRWMDVPIQSLSVNYVGIDYGEIPTSRTLFPGSPPDAITIGGAFRFHNVKQPLFWIKISLEAAKWDERLRFVIAGDGELLDECKAAVALAGCAHKFTFLGAIKDMSRFYENLDLFLHVSQSEGLGNVLLEAQAFGVPVIARNVGGVAETVVHRRSGVLVEGDNVAEFTKILLEIAASADQRSIMGHFAQQYVRKRFGPRQMMNDIINTWRH